MAPPLPKISVVTPSFNQVRYLEETIQSVVDQSYPNLEYVVIDGGSTDGSVEVIERYSNRMAYWVSETDTGHGNALNKGFSQTTGEIMAWLNSDDKYFPWTFRTVADVFSRFPDVNWIMGVGGSWDHRGRLVGTNAIRKNVYDYLLGDYRWIQQESVFWRRSLWENAGGHINEGFRFMVDGELWCRFFRYDQLTHMNCVIGGFRHHEQNRGKLNYAACNEEMRRAIATMRSDLPADIISRAERLRKVRKLKRITGSYLLSRAYNRFGPSLLRNAGYQVLYETPSGWKRMVQPFSL